MSERRWIFDERDIEEACLSFDDLAYHAGTTIEVVDASSFDELRVEYENFKSHTEDVLKKLRAEWRTN